MKNAQEQMMKHVFDGIDVPKESFSEKSEQIIDDLEYEKYLMYAKAAELIESLYQKKEITKEVWEERRGRLIEITDRSDEYYLEFFLFRDLLYQNQYVANLIDSDADVNLGEAFLSGELKMFHPKQFREAERHGCQSLFIRPKIENLYQKVTSTIEGYTGTAFADKMTRPLSTEEDKPSYEVFMLDAHQIADQASPKFYPSDILEQELFVKNMQDVIERQGSTLQWKGLDAAEYFYFALYWLMVHKRRTIDDRTDNDIRTLNMIDLQSSHGTFLLEETLQNPDGARFGYLIKNLGNGFSGSYANRDEEGIARLSLRLKETNGL